MFFSTELLSKRDSGYGLLWLAATLGSISTLKKLHRHSVLTADVNQLCTLISEPPEPLALRLSSNLMVGVVRVFKSQQRYHFSDVLSIISSLQPVKHEIFETDVGSLVASLKKNLQGLHAMDGASLEMAHPNGLREDALNLAVDPAMAMATEFDGTIDAKNLEQVEGDGNFHHVLANNDEFDPFPAAKPGDPSSESRHPPNKNKLHQLDESHDHLFSNSFLHSLSGDVAPIDDPSSSAHMNDVLFNLDFGDPDVGLGEEMERDLEEAWNMKVNKEQVEPVPAAEEFYFEGYFCFFRWPTLRVPMEDNGDLGIGGMDFIDDPFVPGVEVDLGMENGADIPEGDKMIDPSLLRARHTPPPHDQLPSRSILSRRTEDDDVQNEKQHSQEQDVANKAQVRKPGKKHRKRVILLDPRTELSDDTLRFHKNNYLEEMKRQRREAQDKKEQREGKRRVEEELWAPPKDFLAPELVELWNQRVTYPIRAREAAWRKELDERMLSLPLLKRVSEVGMCAVQHPAKKRRVIEKEPSDHVENAAEIAASPIQEGNGIDFGMNMEMDNVVGFDGDYGGMDIYIEPSPVQADINSGSRHSSDEPGHPRRGPSRPPSLPGSSLVGRGAFDVSQRELQSNSIFPWDNAGLSSSNAALPGSVGLPVGGGSGSDLGLSFDSIAVPFRRNSKSNSARDSPAIYLPSGGDAEMVIDDGIEMRDALPVASVDLNPGETQESESMVTLEKNSFNFLG
ncbi:Rec8 like protein-domain-containing protein [Gautieria morchelliformis]|nr:Rec8 like protein-domain-containing protein [Gautieria morchelliformis]